MLILPYICLYYIYMRNIINTLPDTQHAFVAALMKNVGTNQLGLPEGIYRPDFLPQAPGIVKEGEEEKLPVPSLGAEITLSLNEHPEVKAAYVSLDYVEGFPTLDGTPFWIQMSFEPVESYRCFEMYLRQAKSGARQMYTLSLEPAFPEDVSHQDLHDWSDLYFWGPRARSYDMFNAAHRRKERERRAIDSEDSHYLMANRIMDIATVYLDEQGDELAEMMTPKMFLEFVKTATQLGRISVGLPGNGPSTRGEGSSTGEGASMELIMRTIAKESNGEVVEGKIEDNTTKNRSKIQELLKDEKALDMAQELIIKINNPSSPPTPKPTMDTL